MNSRRYYLSKIQNLIFLNHILQSTLMTIKTSLQIPPPVLVQAESCNLNAQHIRRLSTKEVFKLILLAFDNAFVSGTLCFGRRILGRFRTR